MKPDQAVFEALLTSGLPGTKVGWPIGGAPPLPWFTYKRVKGGEFFGDDSNYALMQRYDVDLYQKDADDDVRDEFELALAKVGPFKSIESWIPTEDCWVTSYSVTYHPNK